MAEMDQRTIPAWFVSFSAAMAPFTALCYGHSRGLTARVVDRVVRSPVGVYGLFALPFVTLGMEKSIYDTVQAWQGLDPNVRPADRGGFPSGGAGEDFAVHFSRDRPAEGVAFAPAFSSSWHNLFCFRSHAKNVTEPRAAIVQLDRC
jgi:hypothetical protein